jgi:hypothetical protein
VPELCVYALTSRLSGALNVRGVAGEPLQAIHLGRLDAIVGRVRATPKPTDRNLRRYGRTMSLLWRRTPALLPARFGTSARDVEDLRAMVRARERAIRRGLRAVRHRAQMTIRLVTTHREPPAMVERSSGTSYLRSRQRQQAVPAFTPLRAAVRRWVRQERVEKRAGIASIYHLIPRGSVERYRAALERAAQDAGVRMIASGPFPPHAFADAWS